jgi:hypothetical protein
VSHSCSCSPSGANQGLQLTSCYQCLAYQCLDWTVGSVGMQQREARFLARTGIDVHFGVGSLGGSQSAAGHCYRVSSASYFKDLIVQIVNYGGDVNPGNLDLQVGDGGFGLNNGCVSPETNYPQFDGTASQWGDGYGGWSTEDGCNNLPAYPHCSPETAQDSLQDLCRYSFANGFRLSGGTSACVSLVERDLHVCRRQPNHIEPVPGHLSRGAVGGDGAAAGGRRDW